MTNAAQEIKTLQVKDLIPYARNSRTHDAYQVNQIVSSIKEFGFTLNNFNVKKDTIQ